MTELQYQLDRYEASNARGIGRSDPINVIFNRIVSFKAVVFRKPSNALVFCAHHRVPELMVQSALVSLLDSIQGLDCSKSVLYHPDIKWRTGKRLL